MSTTSTDKNAAIELMEKAVEVIGETVRKDKGDITIKMKVSFFQSSCMTGWKMLTEPVYSPRLFPRPKMQSSKLLWNSSKQPTWTRRVMTNQARRTSKCCSLECRHWRCVVGHLYVSRL